MLGGTVSWARLEKGGGVIHTEPSKDYTHWDPRKRGKKTREWRLPNVLVLLHIWTKGEGNSLEILEPPK